MASDWANVDVLIRELGAMRAAADSVHVLHVARAVIERAVAEATDAVVDTLDAPQDAGGIARAHDAIEVVADVIGTLDDELVSSLRVHARGAVLRRRAVELIEQARGSE
jgi:hypothetical protein